MDPLPSALPIEPPPQFPSQPPPQLQSGLWDEAYQKAYRRHRWLVMVQGMGSGLLALGFVIGLFRALEEEGFGAVCLLFLLLIILIVIALIFFSITFISAAVIGLTGKGKSVGLRLMGLLPLITLFGWVAAVRSLSDSQAWFEVDQTGALALAGFWLGVSFIYLNAALMIPVEQARTRHICAGVSFLPVMVLLGLILVGDFEAAIYLSIALPPFVAVLAAGIIFRLMGRILEMYPLPALPPGGFFMGYPR